MVIKFAFSICQFNDSEVMHFQLPTDKAGDEVWCVIRVLYAPFLRIRNESVYTPLGFGCAL